MPIELLNEYTMTTKDGTDAFHLIEGAKKIGLNAKGIKCDFEYIKNNVKIPFIAHVTINNTCQHYIVVYKIKNNTVKIMDPECGFKTYKNSEFIDIWNKIAIILYPNKSLPIIKSNQNLYSFIFNILKPFKKEIKYMFFISLMITILSISGTYYFKYIVDSINNINNLYIVSFIFLIFILVKIMCEYYRSKIIIFMDKRINKTLTLNTYEHILSLPYKYYKNKTTGDIISRISDLGYIKELITEASVTIFVDAILVVITSMFLYLINNKLFILSSLIEIIYIVIVLVFNKILFIKIEDNFKKNAELNSYLIESISSYETIKGINIKDIILAKFSNIFNKFNNSSNEINKIYNIEQTFKSVINYVGNFTILFFGAMLVIKNEMLIGSLITYNAIFAYFTDPIKNITNFGISIKKSYISLKRVNELYNIEEEKLYEHGNQSITFRGNISIKNLKYTYDDINYLFKNFTLNIKSGEKIMILGMSGSGKSTLMKLLLKYYNCKRNSIFIDDIDINDYNLIDIKKNIKYVSQQELLYNDTLYNNIDIYRNNDISKVSNVCKLVKLDKLISKTPFGLDMVIEENGFNLSGGERQRIILARTLLSEFKILILDEGTNQIDIELERDILNNILKSFKDKTLIFVSHRDNNKDLFDKIVKLERKGIQNG